MRHGPQKRRVRNRRGNRNRREVSASKIGPVLRLTLLAPDIVESILDGRQPAEVTLAVLLQPFAVVWRRQMEVNDPSERFAVSAPLRFRG
jgi:hypothetical protein